MTRGWGRTCGAASQGSLRAFISAFHGLLFPSSPLACRLALHTGSRIPPGSSGRKAPTPSQPVELRHIAAKRPTAGRCPSRVRDALLGPGLGRAPRDALVSPLHPPLSRGSQGLSPVARRPTRPPALAVRYTGPRLVRQTYQPRLDTLEAP